MDSPRDIRVLHVEDDENDSDLTLRELRRGGYRPVWRRVETREELRQALGEAEWDLILSDFSLPGFSGPEALEMVRAAGLDTPFILISGTLGEEAAVAAMKAGAGDYLMKGNLPRLLPAVARELRDAETRRRHREAREELQRQEDRLRHSQKLEAVGRLAGGISHDFNNMLTVISGYTELTLAEMEPGHRALENLRRIKESVDKAAAITRQLLAFSRRQVMAARRFDLNQAAAEMGRMLGPLLPETIRLEVRPSPEPAPIRADPGQIQQVIMNLVLNSRDALPEGGTVKVEVQYPARKSAGDPEGPGPWVLLSVQDDGIGMDADTLSHLFEPFFTTKGDRADASGRTGTGLGLATAYGIIKQSGGHIKVGSRPGQGTRFCIWFPPAPADAMEPAPDQEPALPERGNETVLVAEDDPDLRELICQVLAPRGYRVLKAGNAEEAEEIFLRQGGVDLLLTDMVLPGRDGASLAASLRRHSPSLGVLFISGYSQDSPEGGPVTAPAGAFLEKPFRPAGLLLAVREALEGQVRGCRAVSDPRPDEFLGDSISRAGKRE